MLPAFLAGEKNRGADGVGAESYCDDFDAEREWARDVDNWKNREEDREERDNATAECSDPQQRLRTRANLCDAEDRDGEQDYVNCAVKNIGRVID